MLDRIKRTVLHSPVHGVIEDVARLRGFSSLTVSLPELDFETEVHFPTARRGWVEPYHDTEYYEQLLVRTLVSELASRDTFWDIGSRTGYFSQLAAGVIGPEAIHVFEQMPARCRIVEAINDRYYGGAMTVNRTRIGERDDDRTTSGDGYASRNGPPDAVKIDIEGAEHLALRGMTRLLEEAPPVLLIEMHDAKIRELGGDPEAVRELLETHYDDVSLADEYRRSRTDWRPVAEAWEGRGRHGSYQLFCSP